ncbi:hypothetical protein [Parerythrobacter aestuarii]|uniref:hypothetical protein n=1 Tax=Parerythrobacter aestuarii TaxID=3020909 RepID=UPI0024DEC4A6|nr:hypothetical protein [Parerythrobacter aestuarii]
MAILMLALAACSDASSVREHLEGRMPGATFSEVEEVPLAEFAAAFDEAGISSRSASEFLHEPQFEGARFYKLQSKRTNDYGNEVATLHYCLVNDGQVECQVFKALNSVEEMTRGRKS